MSKELTPREAYILCLRWHPSVGHMTLKEVAKKCDVTPERIRQLEAKSFEKIRSIARELYPNI